MKLKLERMQGRGTIAKRLFRKLHGREPRDGEIGHISLMGEDIIPIGRLNAIAYTATVDGEENAYYHDFAKNRQPVLCSSADGSQLYIIAGKYIITERGIENGSVDAT